MVSPARLASPQLNFFSKQKPAASSRNRSPPLVSGGQLNKIRSSLKLLCPVDEIPQKIKVDISNLDVGDKILLNDVEVHPSVKLLSKNETKPVCKITATSVEAEKSEE